MPTTKLFTWGYYGWGNATSQLIEAVDAVEASRGFAPPVFVDIRIRRTVRAKGFQGNAFENLLGPTRHCWMPSLGNRFIVTRIGPPIQIADPATASDLLEFALTALRSNQRVLFFCSCQWPRYGSTCCHRTTVAGLVLDAARERKRQLQVIEWPGGEPGRVDLDVSAQVFATLRKGRKTVPLGDRIQLSEYAAIPWGSLAVLRCGGEQLSRVVGPAIRQPAQWALPVLYQGEGQEPTSAECQQAAVRLRRYYGLEVTDINNYYPGREHHHTNPKR
jgi:hypothetical protein